MVTQCVNPRRPLLSHPDIHALLRKAWHEANRWRIGRYMVMPDHVHFFCAPADRTTRLSTWMSFWRAAVTRNWPRPGEKPIWQKNYWDTQLRQGESYAAKWAYVRNNPVKQGLAADEDAWPYQGEMEVLTWIER